MSPKALLRAGSSFCYNNLMASRILFILSFLFILGISSSLPAQEYLDDHPNQDLLDPEENFPDIDDPLPEEAYVSPEDFENNPELPFTGTLDPDDPDNEDYREDLEFFNEEPLDEESDDLLYTHEFRFDFEGVLQFFPMDPLDLIGFENASNAVLSGSPDVVIRYKLKLLEEVSLNSKRPHRNDLKIEVIIENQGSLLQNELYDCRIEVEPIDMEASLNLRLKKEKNKDIPPEELDEENQPVSLGIKFKWKKISENWECICRDSNFFEVKSVGDHEYYLDKILKKMTPSLKSYFSENYSKLEPLRIDLVSDEEIFSDTEISYFIVLSGEGQIEIEPFN